MNIIDLIALTSCSIFEVAGWADFAEWTIDDNWTRAFRAQTPVLIWYNLPR